MRETLYLKPGPHRDTWLLYNVEPNYFSVGTCPDNGYGGTVYERIVWHHENDAAHVKITREEGRKIRQYTDRCCGVWTRRIPGKLSLRSGNTFAINVEPKQYDPHYSRPGEWACLKPLFALADRIESELEAERYLDVPGPQTVYEPHDWEPLLHYDWPAYALSIPDLAEELDYLEPYERQTMLERITA